MADKKRDAPDIDEATVFFEVVLPQLCEKYAEALQQMGAEREIELRLRARPPRAWVVQGGEGPWVRRGQVESGEPDMVVTFSEDLVKLVVNGGEPDLNEAVNSGHLEIGGNKEVLTALGFDLDALPNA